MDYLFENITNQRKSGSTPHSATSKFIEKKRVSQVVILTILEKSTKTMQIFAQRNINQREDYSTVTGSASCISSKDKSKDSTFP